MRKNRGLLESIVYEEPESGFNAPFGKYAFDDKRHELPKDQKEKPTPDETKAAQAIDLYLTQNDKSQLDGVANQLASLAKAGKYQPILDPSGASVVYRILQVRRDVAAKILRVPVDDQHLEGTVNGGTLTPNNTRVSGWTTRKELVREFSPLGDGGDTLILLAAPVKGNTFFGKPGEFARMFSPGFQSEMETMAVGPVKFSKAAFCVLQTEDGNYRDANGPETLLRLIG